MQLFGLMLALLLVPQVQVKWLKDEVAIREELEGTWESFESCIVGGFEAQIRFETKLCKRRKWWLDGCEEYRTEVRSARFDPISETYKLEADRYGDELPRQIVNTSTREAAYDYVRRIPAVTLKFLARTNQELLNHDKLYVSARIIGDCRGQASETLSTVSSVLTFGLLSVANFDTNWIDFPLERGTP